MHKQQRIQQFSAGIHKVYKTISDACSDQLQYLFRFWKKGYLNACMKEKGWYTALRADGACAKSLLYGLNPKGK
jgi:hypothetical protein